MAGRKGIVSSRCLSMPTENWFKVFNTEKGDASQVNSRFANNKARKIFLQNVQVVFCHPLALDLAVATLFRRIFVQKNVDFNFRS